MVVDFPGDGRGDVGGSETGSTPSTSGDSGDSGDSPVPGASIVGDAAGDGLGALGLWAIPGGFAVGEDGRLGLFDRASIGPETPFSSAQTTWSAGGLGSAFADLGAQHAVAGGGTVWVVPAWPGGAADPAAEALAIVSPDAGGEAGRLGDALAAGDWDGDGLPDLAVGDPTSRGGEGQAYVQVAPLGGSVADVALRGTGAGGLGRALAMGDLDGVGTDGLWACESGRCWMVAGGGAISDRVVSEVAAASVSGAVADPRAVDVDGDGALDLVVGGGAAVGVFFGPIAGARSLADADLLATGAGLGGATGWAGEVVVGVPAGAGAVVAGVGDLAGAAVLWTGDADGDALGTRVSDVRAGELAVSAPGSDRVGVDAGLVRIVAAP
jgi:hypothetical protein